MDNSPCAHSGKGLATCRVGHARTGAVGAIVISATVGENSINGFRSGSQTSERPGRVRLPRYSNPVLYEGAVTGAESSRNDGQWADLLTVET